MNKRYSEGLLPFVARAAIALDARASAPEGVSAERMVELVTSAAAIAGDKTPPKLYKDGDYLDDLVGDLAKLIGKPAGDDFEERVVRLVRACGAKYEVLG